MRCECCGRFYLDEDHLSAIFKFSDCCSSCKKQFQPHLMVEVFPIEHGMVEYHYLYQDKALTIKQRRYLSKHLSIIFCQIILKTHQYDLFIFFDDQMKHQMNELSWLLNGFSRVLMFSLVRREVIHNRDFFLE